MSNTDNILEKGKGSVSVDMHPDITDGGSLPAPNNDDKTVVIGTDKSPTGDKS